MFSEAAAAVIVCEKQGDRLMIRAPSSGLGEAGAAPESLPAEHSFAELVVQQNRTASLDDVSLRPDLSILQFPAWGPSKRSLPPRCNGPAGPSARLSSTVASGRSGRPSSSAWPSGWRPNAHHTLEALRMQQELARVASFPTLNPNPIVEADSDGRVSYTNPAAQRLFPDIQQRGADHPWLANWPAVAEACRTGRACPAARWPLTIASITQTIHFTPQTGRIRTYGLDVTDASGRRRWSQRIAISSAAYRQPTRLRLCQRCAEPLSAANCAIARLMGVATPNDLLGKSDADFYPPNWRRSILPTKRNCCERGSR